MIKDPYLLSDISRNWYYFGTEGGTVLRTTIPERAKRYQNIALANRSADALAAEHKAYFEPILMSRTAGANRMTRLMNIPELDEKRRTIHEKQSQKRHDDRQLG